MASISALSIGGTPYDIYAASAVTAGSASYATTADSAGTAANATQAGSATKLTAARTLSVTGHVTGSVSTDWGSNKTLNLTVTTAPWSAMGGVSAADVSGNAATGFVTPKEIVEYVKTVTGNAVGAAYKHKGTTAVTSLSTITPAKGDVYNVTGCGDAGTTLNGQLVFNGDNLVATAATKAAASWDKLAATFDASNYITTATWNTSTGVWNNATATVKTNSASNWPNTAHKAFTYINAGADKLSANSYTATVTFTGKNGIQVTGAGSTVTISPTAYAYGSITVDGSKTQATAMGDSFGFSAGDNMKLTLANNVISLSAKDTTWKEASTTELGMNYASYVTGTTAVLF